MTLYELAFSCWVFGHALDVGTATQDLLQAVDGDPDPGDAEHRRALLKWLNGWGCRQFAKSSHGLASEEMLDWHRECAGLLPSRKEHLWELSDGQVKAACETHAKLSAKRASVRSDGVTMSFGAVGAAKLLFALRPRALAPWDSAIQRARGHGEAAESYCLYLRHVKELLLSLEPLCRDLGCTLQELPALVGREMSTPVKLIDEYYWVTVTRDCRPPKPERLQQWLGWVELAPTDICEDAGPRAHQ